jgi:hypothetical protein
MGKINFNTPNIYPRSWKRIGKPEMNERINGRVFAPQSLYPPTII